MYIDGHCKYAVYEGRKYVAACGGASFQPQSVCTVCF